MKNIVFSVIALGLASVAQAAQVTLNWSDNSTNESGFRIMKAVGGGDWTEAATVAAGVTTYVDTNVDVNSMYGYYYKVCAYNDAGDSGYSNIAALQATENAAQHVTVSRTATANTAFLGVALLAGFESDGVDDDVLLNDPDITATSALMEIVSSGGNMYDVRYTTATPNARSFGSYTQVADEPTPSAAGGIDGIPITGLTPGTRYNIVYKVRTGSTWSAMKSAGYFTTQPTLDKQWQVSWQQPPGNPYVYGYRVYVTVNGSTTQSYDVGNVTSCDLTGLAYSDSVEIAVYSLYFVGGQVVEGPISNVVEIDGQ